MPLDLDSLFAAVMIEFGIFSENGRLAIVPSPRIFPDCLSNGIRSIKKSTRRIGWGGHPDNTVEFMMYQCRSENLLINTAAIIGDAIKMDWLTFIAEFVKATAWPVIVLIAVLVFRGELSALLGRLKKGKIGGAEFEFEDAVAQLRADSEPLPEVRAVNMSVVSDNPRIAILEAWLRVEDSARKLAGAQGISPSLVAVARAPVLIKAIEEKNLLSPEQVQLFHDLRRLRNQAAPVGDFSPSSESVVSYVSLANGLAAAIERKVAS